MFWCYTSSCLNLFASESDLKPKVTCVGLVDVRTITECCSSLTSQFTCIVFTTYTCLTWDRWILITCIPPCGLRWFQRKYCWLKSTSTKDVSPHLNVPTRLHTGRTQQRWRDCTCLHCCKSFTLHNVLFIKLSDLLQLCEVMYSRLYGSKLLILFD